jgi:hypothetical protein
MTDRQVMQQALEALENHEGNYKLGNAGCDRQEAAITAIKEALAQPAQPVQEPTPWRDMVVVSLVREGINKHRARELADHFVNLTLTPPLPVQEPVAWMSADRAWMWSDYIKAIAAVANIPTLTLIPLYTTPPQRKPLTDEQVKELLLIAPVYAPDGAVTRTPFAYRKELLDTALWALRKAEAAHGIKEQS